MKSDANLISQNDEKNDDDYEWEGKEANKKKSKHFHVELNVECRMSFDETTLDIDDEENSKSENGNLLEKRVFNVFFCCFLVGSFLCRLGSFPFLSNKFHLPTFTYVGS